MATMFSVQKTERTKTRQLPLLPRIGVVVDVAGRKFTFRYAPLLETALNVKSRGLTLKALRTVVSEQLAEIKFPASLEAGLAAVRNLRPTKAQATRGVKKASPKAAAKKAEPAPV